ncbi:MAG: tandem-95 repeat protein [Thiohalomonadales bacterium]
METIFVEEKPLKVRSGNVVNAVSLFSIAILIFLIVQLLDKPDVDLCLGGCRSSSESAALVIESTVMNSTAIKPAESGHHAVLDNLWRARAHQSIIERQHQILLLEQDNKNEGGPQTDNQWYTDNHRQQIRSIFTRDTIQFSPLQTSTMSSSGWKVGMQLIAAGFDNKPQPVSTPVVSVHKNTIIYKRDTFNEWYKNTAQGIEQGYTIHQSFATKRTSSFSKDPVIELRIELSGIDTVDRDSQGNYLIHPLNSTQTLNYGQLHATDAVGKHLDSEMSISNHVISLRIHTEDSIYPITIDPLIGSSSDNCQLANIWCDGASFESSEYGYPVKGVGDVNGDGFDDVIIGDPFYNVSGPNVNEGAVYLFYGSATGLSHNIAWTQTGNSPSANYGYSVGVADVNGDSINDVIVGAPGQSATDGVGASIANTGVVYVYYGGLATGLATTASWIARPSTFGIRFGEAVAGAGDVNGDGFEDIIVGAPKFEGIDALGNPLLQAGAAFVYHGSSTGLSSTLVADWHVESKQANAELGTSVSSAGNVNGDRASTGFAIDDILIGIIFYNSTDPISKVVYTNAGRVIAYYGSEATGAVAGGLSTIADPAKEFSAKPDWSFQLYEEFANLGISVASAGNVNGDSSSAKNPLPLDDILIGANNIRSVLAGSAYLFHGSDVVGIEAKQAWSIRGEQGNSLFGHVVASAGDINGDSFDDIIIGDPLYSNIGSQEGKAYIYLGPIAANRRIADWTGTGTVDWDFFAYSVSGVGDINNDGYSDIMVGVPGGRSYSPDPTLELGLASLYTGAGNSDLAVTMTSAAQLANSPVDVAITVTNNGPDSAHKIIISDSWSAAGIVASIVPSILATKWNCAVDNVGKKVVCPAAGDTNTNIRLASGASATVTVQLTSAAVPFSHTARANSDSIVDPVLANNSVASQDLNSPPQASRIVVSTNEDIAILNQPFAVTDPDPGAVFSYALLANPTQGNVVINATTDSFDYQPNLNYFGTDAFEFEAFDEFGAGTGPTVVSINIVSVNDPPVAQLGLQFSVNLGSSVSDKFSARDVDSTNLIYSIAPTFAPLKGTVVITNPATGAFTYTPSTTTAVGTDQFNFIVADNADAALALTDSASVGITINANNINTAPTIIANQSIILDEDVLTTGMITARDTETPNNLIYSLVTGPGSDPQLGSVSITNATTGAFSYQPNLNVSGTDAFAFRVTDTSTKPLSSTGFMAITINPVNDAPVAAPVSITVAEDSTTNKPTTLLGSDVDSNDILTYTISGGVNGPKKGVVTLANNRTAFVYVPEANLSGTDTFQYTVRDSAGATAIADISVIISPVNDAPLLSTSTTNISLDEDSTLLVTLSATDIDSNGLRFTLNSLSNSKVPITDIVLNPQADKKSVQFTYTPKANFNGLETVEYTVSDDALPTAATVSGVLDIIVKAVNDIPIAIDTTKDSNGNALIISEDAMLALQFDLQATDIDQTVGLNASPDSEILKFSIENSPANTSVDTAKGRITFNGRSQAGISYLPKKNAFGVDSFNFSVFDISGLSSTAKVSIEITPVNDAPVIDIPISTTFNVFSEQADLINITQFVSDVDSTVFNYSLPNGQTTVNGGSVSIVDPSIGQFSYTSSANFVGTDSFNIRVADDLGLQSNINTLSVIVNSKASGNPIADNIDRGIDEDMTLSGVMQASVVSGIISRYVIVDKPILGSVKIKEDPINEFTYTPNLNFTGSDTFTYRAIDSNQRQSAAATVTVTINPINDPPVIDMKNSDIYNTVAAASDIVLTGRLSVTDVDSDVLTFSIATQPLRGSAQIDSTGEFTYTSTIGVRGEDQFSVSVTDGEANGEVSQTIILCVVIPGEDCSDITHPSLVSPKHNADALSTTVRFEWKGSSYKNLKNNLDSGSIAYQVLYCTTSTFVGCSPIDVQQKIASANDYNASVAFTLGGTSTGLFLFGLLGGGLSTRRKIYPLAIMALLSLSLLNACNSGAEDTSIEVPLKPTFEIDGGHIIYTDNNLLPGKTYYWKVIAIDADTNKTSESGIFSFTTAS